MEKYFTVKYRKGNIDMILDFSPTGFIAQRLKEGMLVAEIARELGTDPSRLYEKGKEAGMPIPRLRTIVCDNDNEKLLALESKLYKKAIEDEDLKAQMFLVERIDRMKREEKGENGSITLVFDSRHEETDYTD